MNKEERDKLIDGFFNKGWACDLDEVYEAVVGTIKDLEEANDNKIKQIDQLTNNWNELEEWLIDLKTPKTNYWGDTGFTYMLKIDVILDKMKEIKEGKK